MGLCLLGRSRSGVGAGVGVDIFRPESESELESLEIRRLRSPAVKRGRHIGESGVVPPIRATLAIKVLTICKQNNLVVLAVEKHASCGHGTLPSLFRNLVRMSEWVASEGQTRATLPLSPLRRLFSEKNGGGG